MNTERVRTIKEKKMLKYMLEHDGVMFMRYFFKIREGTKLFLNWHHYVIEYVLQAVFDGKINRLIINLAPGYSKTEQCVLNFIARGFAINPRSKFIHASYSSDLAQDNSLKIKDIISEKGYHELWGLELRTDSKSKKRWNTKQGGGLMASSAGGQITGFRAGLMAKGFNGAFIIDDPVKPDDAYSNVRRKFINNRFMNTMRSRLALESTPLIIIMQRLHENDLSGHLLSGGGGEMYHHLKIPTLIDGTDDACPSTNTHCKHININTVLTCLANNKDYEF